MRVTPAPVWNYLFPDSPFVKACSNVIECNCVTGDYSMVLEVLFPSTIELDQFIGELQRFGRTKTLIVFSTSVEHRGITAEIDSKGMGDKGKSEGMT